MNSEPSSPIDVIGIDVGGTKIAAGSMAFPEGRIIARRTIPTQPSRGGRAVLDDILRLARDLAAGVESLQAVGLGVCELVDRDGNLASANCLPWLDLPVREELSGIAPAVIEADVRAAALAEFMFGAGRPYRSFLYVTIGTGISCCFMQNGQPWLGATGAAGTMASSPLSVPCEACGHLSRRTLEEIAAGPALAARFVGDGGIAENAQEVLAADGDPRADAVIQTATEALGAQVGLLLNVLDPEALIIGGGLGLSEGRFHETLVSAARHHIWSPARRDIPIFRAATGIDAGWIGAAARAARDSHR